MQSKEIDLGTVAAVDAQAVESEALSAVAAADTVDEIESARIDYLGRKSALKLALREVRDRETGMTLNAVRERIEVGDRRPRWRSSGAPSSIAG